MDENINFNGQQAVNLPPLPQQKIIYNNLNNAKVSEKSQIRKASHAAGVSLVALETCSFILSIILLLFSLVTSKNQLQFEIDPGIEMAFQAVASIFLFTAPFIAIYKLFGYRISNLVSFKKSPKGLALPFFFFGVGFSAFSNITTNYIDTFFQNFGIDYAPTDMELPTGFFGFLLTFIATAVTPALVEEFACRGIIMGSLRKFGDGFAIVASAVVFGLMHGNFQQIPFAFLMGLILGFAAVKTGSLRVSVAIHFFNNFISVFFSYLPESINENFINLFYYLFLLASLLVGIWFIKRDKEGTFFTLEPSTFEATFTKKQTWFFTSFTIIIFMVGCLLESVSLIFFK